MLVAVVAAAAVTVPITILARSGDQQQSPAAPPVVNAGEVEFPYRPGWLPDRMVEVRRGASPDGTSGYRMWSYPGDQKAISVGLSLVSEQHPLPQDSMLSVNEEVDINGAAGTVMSRQDGTDAIVYWTAGAGKRLMVPVYKLPDAKTIALRMARSVTSDTSTWTMPVDFGWYPDTFRPTSIEVSGSSPTDWAASLQADPTVDAQGKRLLVSLGTTELQTNGSDWRQIQIRGTTGAYTETPLNEGGSDGMLRVQLDDGRWLEVRGPLPENELVRVADGLAISPAGSHTWIGAR